MLQHKHGIYSSRMIEGRVYKNNGYLMVSCNGGLNQMRSVGSDTEWITVDLEHPMPSHDDWVGVFSPAKFNGSTCYLENDPKEQAPYICTAPIKYNFANFSNPGYVETAKNFSEVPINQSAAYFSLALFTSGLSNKVGHDLWNINYALDFPVWAALFTDKSISSQPLDLQDVPAPKSLEFFWLNTCSDS